MHIEALSIDTFSKFGEVGCAEGKYAKNEVDMHSNKTLELHSEQLAFLWQLSGDRCGLEPINGLTVLCVALPTDPENPTCFLLDQFAVLNAGVLFNLVPLYETSQVNLLAPHTESLKEIPLLQTFSPMGKLSEITLGNIYTVFRQEKPQGFEFTGERHAFWEMTVAERGTLSHEVDGITFQTLPNEICFYGKDQFHKQWATEAEGVSFVTLTFEMEIELPEILTGQCFEADERLLRLIQMILKEYRSGAYGALTLVRCYLKEFIILLIRAQRMKNALKDSAPAVKHLVESATVRQVMDAMREHLSKKWTLSELAGLVFISASHLSFIFKRETGETIIEWLHRSKMERAQELVLLGKLSITEISEQLGFASIHYFSRVFKLWFGMSPSAYAQGYNQEKRLPM